ncbi:hypothetical protein ACWEOI_12700 [Nocardia sp. NPDC004340]
MAASLAAALSAATLYISGRRENRKWLREALIDAYVEYLDTGVLRATFEREQPPIDNENWAAARDKQHHAREQFVDVTRKSLQLGQGSSVTRTMFDLPAT